jgi:hypothetical protein
MYISPFRCVKKVSSTTEVEKRDAKTIWIFTNQDNPITSTNPSAEKESLITVARDLFYNDHFIKMWPLPNKTGRQFNNALFYNEIIDNDEDKSDNNNDDGSHKVEIAGSSLKVLHDDSATEQNSDSTQTLDIESLLEEIGRRWKNIRKSLTIPMFLPDWRLHMGGKKSDDESQYGNGYPGIMLDLYPCIRFKRKPNPITVDARTNK